MNIWFTSDWHLGHENIIKLCNRPFTTVQEMDEALISNYNELVGDDDIVYFLGDFSWWKKSNAEYLEQMRRPFNHVLRGNHDTVENLIRLASSKSSDIFGDVQDYIEAEHRDKKFVLCHYPIEDWNGRYKGSIHLHGHTHGQHLVQGINANVRNGSDTTHKIDETGLRVMPNRFDVSVECTGYRPIHLDEILAMVKK